MKYTESCSPSDHTISAFSEPGRQTVSDPMAQKPSESMQCTDRLSSSTVNHVIIEFVMYCGRAVFICYPVYLLGYLGINISWVLLCVFMLTYWKKNRQWKVARITSAIDLVDNEKRAIKTELRSALPMASWVCSVFLLQPKLLREVFNHHTSSSSTNAVMHDTVTHQLLTLMSKS